MENHTDFDVLVAGAGAGGICAALAAARSGARTLLLEKSPSIGGTGIHSPVSLVCKFHGTDHRPINMGIHRELFPHVYLYSTRDMRPTAPRLTYDETELARTYDRLLRAEPLLTCRTGEGVATVETDHRRIRSISTEKGTRYRVPVYVDGTADGNLSAMAGCRFQKGRPEDGAMQSATLVFGLKGIDRSLLRIREYQTRGGLDSLWEEMTALYLAAKERGQTDNPRHSVVAFPYPDGERLLFNSNEVLGVDPTRPGSVQEALKIGRRRVDELVAILRQHPAFQTARIDFVASRLGVREGRRIVGDYLLTREDCLGEARFDDMVAASAYEIDIHDPDGGPAVMVNIPGSGYYHIPYRSLLPADLDNLLLGSRCISGTHESHSSYRVISGVTAIGQAAGTAASLAALHTDGEVRKIPAPAIRFELRRQLQFVEGSVTKLQVEHS
ncbi:MAG TPA: FAD-dependent oxidoreductase [Oceanipulchritudo sp.]|nr:FAD-dependent oxidoreductase [Oceanipulchritudo sp.]